MTASYSNWSIGGVLARKITGFKRDFGNGCNPVPLINHIKHGEGENLMCTPPRTATIPQATLLPIERAECRQPVGLPRIVCQNQDLCARRWCH